MYLISRDENIEMNDDTQKQNLLEGRFFFIMSCWSILGALALIHSLARLRFATASRVADRTVSLTVAIIFGPLYWVGWALGAFNP